MQHTTQLHIHLHQQEPVGVSHKSPEFPSNLPRNAGKNRERQTQLNLSKVNSSESKSMEDEGEAQPPPNIVPFPAARADRADDADVEPAFSEKRVVEATKQVAAILKVPVTDNLQRVVADYLGDASLSLLGEADAAREWIEDHKRNSKRKPLTPVFFRRWLKREHEAAHRGYTPPGPSQQETPNATCPPSIHATSALANGIGPPDMQVTTPTEHLENPYQAFVRTRAQAALRQAVSSQKEARHEATP